MTKNQLTIIFCAALFAGAASDLQAAAKPGTRLEKRGESETTAYVSTGTSGGDSAATGGAGLTYGHRHGSPKASSAGSSSSGGGAGDGAGAKASGGSSTPKGGDSTAFPKTSGKLVFSDTYDGAAKATFLTTQVVYGAAYGLKPDSTYGCTCPKTSAYCNSRENWTKMPNEDWTYIPKDKAWRMARAFTDIPPGLYMSIFEDRSNGASTGFVQLQLTPPPTSTCRWSSPDPVVGPCSGPYVNGMLLSCSGDNKGQKLDTSGGGESCPAHWTCQCN